MTYTRAKYKGKRGKGRERFGRVSAVEEKMKI